MRTMPVFLSLFSLVALGIGCGRGADDDVTTVATTRALHAHEKGWQWQHSHAKHEEKHKCDGGLKDAGPEPNDGSADAHRDGGAVPADVATDLATDVDSGSDASCECLPSSTRCGPNGGSSQYCYPTSGECGAWGIEVACGPHQQCAQLDAGFSCQCKVELGCLGAPSCAQDALNVCSADAQGCLFLETKPCAPGLRCMAANGSASCICSYAFAGDPNHPCWGRSGPPGVSKCVDGLGYCRINPVNMCPEFVSCFPSGTCNDVPEPDGQGCRPLNPCGLQGQMCCVDGSCASADLSCSPFLTCQRIPDGGS